MSLSKQESHLATIFVCSPCSVVIERQDLLALMPCKRAKSPERWVLPFKKRKITFQYPSPTLGNVPAAGPSLEVRPRIKIKFTQTGPGFYEVSDLSSLTSTGEDSTDALDDKLTALVSPDGSSEISFTRD